MYVKIYQSMFVGARRYSIGCLSCNLFEGNIIGITIKEDITKVREKKSRFSTQTKLLMPFKKFLKSVANMVKL
jgi:hypothetical protein